MEHDIRLLCLTLRALYGQDLITCLAVIVDVAATQEDMQTQEGATESVREILDEVRPISMRPAAVHA